MRVASTSMNVDPQVSADKVTESVLIHHASAPATCLTRIIHEGPESPHGRCDRRAHGPPGVAFVGRRRDSN